MRDSRTRSLIWAGGFLLVFLLSACRNTEEERKKEMIQKQINLIERQFQEMESGRSELSARTAKLSVLLRQYESEMAGVHPRLISAEGANAYLRELTAVGFGPSPGKWILTNFWLTPPVLLLIGLGILALWILFRLRQHQLEAEMSQEINRVIDRLAHEASKEKTESAPPAALTPSSASPREKEKPPEKAAAPKIPHPLPREDEQPKEPAPGEDDSAPQEPAEASHPAPSSETAHPAPGPLPETAEKVPPPSAEKKDHAEPAPSTQEARPTPPPKKLKKTGALTRPGEKKEGRRSPVRKVVSKRCKVKGCPNKHRSKGFCNKHYQQWRNGILKEEIEEE